MANKNPAIRLFLLLEFLDKKQKKDNRITFKQAYSEFFKVETPLEIYRRLYWLNFEINQIEKKLLEKDMLKNPYKGAINTLKKIIDNNCLSHSINEIDTKDLTIIEVFSDLLYQGVDEINHDGLEQLKKQVESFEKLVQTIEDKFLKEKLNEIVDELKEALELHLNFGFEMLKEKNLIIIGKTVLVAPKLDDKIKKKLWGIIVGISAYCVNEVKEYLIEKLEEIPLLENLQGEN